MNHALIIDAVRSPRGRGNDKGSLKSIKPVPAVKTPAKAKGPAKAVRGKGRVLVENHVPGSVRGSVRKQVARAQAKRDAR